MTEQYDSTVNKVAAFLDGNYSHEACDMDCPGNYDEAATIVDMVLSGMAGGLVND